jgi:hypothetical protein
MKIAGRKTRSCIFHQRFAVVFPNQIIEGNMSPRSRWDRRLWPSGTELCPVSSVSSVETVRSPNIYRSYVCSQMHCYGYSSKKKSEISINCPIFIVFSLSTPAARFTDSNLIIFVQRVD